MNCQLSSSSRRYGRHITSSSVSMWCLASSLGVVSMTLAGAANARPWLLPTHYENTHGGVRIVGRGVRIGGRVRIGGSVTTADRARVPDRHAAVSPTPADEVKPTPDVKPPIFHAHVPDFSFRLLKDGTEVEIAGGFKPGLARAFFDYVRDKPQIRILHLWSTGGLVSEARLVNTWARLHGVDTYVDHYCMSACTLVFLAGKDRWLGPKGRLGFHAAYRYDQFGHEHVADKAPASDLLFADGVPTSFIDRANKVAPSDMWFPTKEELQAAHVVTGMAAPSKFGTSLYLDEWTNRLKARYPITIQLAATHEGDFQALATTTADARIGGADDASINKLEGVVMRRLLRTYLATINDDHLVIDYGKVRSEELTFIDSKDPVACYAQSHADQGHDVDELNAPYADRKADIYRRILASTPVSGKAPAVPKPVIDRFVRLMLKKASVADIRALAKPVKDVPTQARYCRALEAEYEAAVRLPTSDAVLVLRNM